MLDEPRANTAQAAPNTTIPATITGSRPMRSAMTPAG